MRTITKLLFLLLIFGCKNQTQPKKESIPKISQKNTRAAKRNPIYDLIVLKKEKADDLEKEFSYDSIISLTDEEKSEYKKIGLEDGYYLTSIDFLKKPIDSIEFQVYYKISYGSEREKLVRIKRKDTIFDLSLAFTGGDGGQSWQGDTEFLNDSIFQKVNVFTETAIDSRHLMAYATDSIIRKFYYDEKLNVREVKKDSFHIYKKHPIYHRILKDSIFKTWSNFFTINGIKCRWEYEVEYMDETNENSEAILVNIVSQKLNTWKTNETILDLDLSLFPFLYPKNAFHLEFHDFEPQDFDINFDGYTDFQFYDGVQGGANHEYFVYLFNPNTQKFEFSKELTGGSMADKGIELNKEKKIAYYSGKSGGGLYGIKKVYFDNKGQIKYMERYWNDDLGEYSEAGLKFAFYYIKYKDKITLDSLSVVKELKNEGLESIYQPFFEWIDSLEQK